MLNKTTLLALQKEVREVNELNGWFDRERPFSADIALLHSEVSELYEGFRNGDLANMAEEAADVLIRLLDTAERKGVVELEWVDPSPWEPLHVSDAIMEMHFHISALRGLGLTPAGVAIRLRRLLLVLSTFVSQHEIDLFTEVEKKLEKNRQRGYRHGGKVE